MKAICTFIRTTYREKGKSPVYCEFRLPGGGMDLHRLLGPKYRGHFLEELLTRKLAIIEKPNKVVTWEMFEREVHF